MEEIEKNINGEDINTSLVENTSNETNEESYK